MFGEGERRLPPRPALASALVGVSGSLCYEKGVDSTARQVGSDPPDPCTRTSRFRELTLSSDAQYFSWTLGRAAGTFYLMLCVNDIVAQLPTAAACHMGRCAARGVPLVNGLSIEGKALYAHLHIFSVFLRQLKSLHAIMKRAPMHAIAC